MIRDRTLLLKAIINRLATAEEVALYFAEPEPDPLENLTLEERWDAAIPLAASGAWADCPRPTATINGRTIPAPPTHRIRRGPRGRSPRGKGTAPPDATHTDADQAPATAPPADHARPAHGNTAPDPSTSD